jgi:hypothetical protein
MTRRRFAFWLGFSLFNLAERLRAGGLDTLAAATMRTTEPVAADNAAYSSAPTHWRTDEDSTWRWYERENYIDGEWLPTGITTPINKQTGDRKDGHGVYLDDSLLPAELRLSEQARAAQAEAPTATEHDPQLPTPECRARHGRPPSKWLRSLHAEEIRIWLGTIKVPEADVSGMTFWEHLTRDHFFEPDHIVGLTIAELAKLHGAAHFGY